MPFFLAFEPYVHVTLNSADFDVVLISCGRIATKASEGRGKPILAMSYYRYSHDDKLISMVATIHHRTVPPCNGGFPAHLAQVN